MSNPHIVLHGEELAPGCAVYDVVIVGGGPAGLSAALVLGRCRRRVLLCDAGAPRNAASRALHGFLTRDGLAPLELLHLGREELRPYGIVPRQVAVTAITQSAGGFDVALENGERTQTRTVLIATGVRDNLPNIPGLQECYGISVHHCPYCDGWEVRDRKLIVLGTGQNAAGLALSLKTWSADVTICSNGRARIGATHRQQLQREAIPVIEHRIDRLVHEAGQATAIVFADGAEHRCDALFFSSGQVMQSDLPRSLGCEFTPKGVVKTDDLGLTCIPGVYVVGDASRDMQFVVVAAAEGAKAAVAINKMLQAKSGLAVTPPASPAVSP
jgi:thioredoxin reductase